jgi:hypothetical protein
MSYLSQVFTIFSFTFPILMTYIDFFMSNEEEVGNPGPYFLMTWTMGPYHSRGNSAWWVGDGFTRHFRMAAPWLLTNERLPCGCHTLSKLLYYYPWHKDFIATCHVRPHVLSTENAFFLLFIALFLAILFS